jgi:tetratricopeptide (TPR) repeat protein
MGVCCLQDTPENSEPPGETVTHRFTKSVGSIDSLLWGLVVLLAPMLLWRLLLSGWYSNLGSYELIRSLLESQGSRLRQVAAEHYATRALALHPRSTSALRIFARSAFESHSANSDSTAGLPNPSSYNKDDISRFYLGMHLWRTGRMEEALIMWQDNRGQVWYFVNYGNSLYADGESEKALEQYAIAEAINRTTHLGKAQMYTNVCEVNSRQQRLDQAVDWCMRAVQVHPTVWSLLRLGELYHRSGEYQTALGIFEDAQELRGDVPRVYYRLGLTYYKIGNAQLALHNYEYGLSLAPHDTLLNWEAAGLYLEMGDRQRAYCCYKQLIEYGDKEQLVNQARIGAEHLLSEVDSELCDE